MTSCSTCGVSIAITSARFCPACGAAALQSDPAPDGRPIPERLLALGEQAREAFRREDIIPILSELRDLAASNPHDAAVAAALADSVSSLALKCSHPLEGNRHEIPDLVDELSDLERRFPDNGEIVASLTRTYCALPKGNSYELSDRVEQLQIFADRFPSRSDIADDLSVAVLNRIEVYGTSADEARHLVALLVKLANEHQSAGPHQSLGLALRCANGVAVLIVMSEVDECEARGLVAVVRALAERHPDNGPLARWLAEAVFQWLRKGGVSDDEISAGIREIGAAAKVTKRLEFLERSRIAECLSSLVVGSLPARESLAAINELRRISESDPESADLARHYALSLCALRQTHKVGVSDLDLRNATVEARRISALHPGDPKIGEIAWSMEQGGPCTAF